MNRRGKKALGPAINRVPLGTLNVFEITEAELDALERGSPESLFFNLGIAAFSIGCSFLISLLTTTIDNTRTFCVFVIVCTIGFVSGITFALLWWLSRRSVRNVAKEIRSRMAFTAEQKNEEQTEQGSWQKGWITRSHYITATVAVLMTELLSHAFAEAAKLPPAEQDLLAMWLLSEVAPESGFDRRIAATADKLTPLASEAIQSFCTGKTAKLDPDRL